MTDPQPESEARRAPTYLQSTQWTFTAAVGVFFAGVVGALVAASVAQGLDPDISDIDFAISVFIGQFLGYGSAVWYLTDRNEGADLGLRLQRRDWWGLPAGFVMQIVVTLALSPLIEWLGGGEEPQQQVAELSTQLTGGWHIGAFGLAVVVMAPFFEEVIFRGLLLSRLLRSVPSWAAVLLSAAAFGGVHLADPDAVFVVPGLIVIGLVLGFAALWSGSLGLPIMIHAGSNLTAFVALVALAGDPEPAQGLLWPVGLGLLFG